MRLSRVIGLVPLLAFAGVLAAYRIKDPERRVLDDAAGKQAPGKFIHLGDGVTHYEVAGPDSGQGVLFVRQMAELLDTLQVLGPVALASISYGAAMVTSFADRYPGRVRALVYLDPVFNNRRRLPPQERSALGVGGSAAPFESERIADRIQELESLHRNLGFPDEGRNTDLGLGRGAALEADAEGPRELRTGE
jgi:pimeloyl-ACP methyl ester carboxylesterase